MLLLLIWCSRTQLHAVVLLMVGEPTFVLAAHSAWPMKHRPCSTCASFAIVRKNKYNQCALWIIMEEKCWLNIYRPDHGVYTCLVSPATPSYLSTSQQFSCIFLPLHVSISLSTVSSSTTYMLLCLTSSLDSCSQCFGCRILHAGHW